MNYKNTNPIIILAFLTILCSNTLLCKELAFTGALGFGQFTQGGKGAEIYRVTTLADNDQPGSFRYGARLKSPRQIHFDVSGVILLNKPLKIKSGFVSILGQTSPNGIVIMGAPVSINAEQVILQHLRFRLGTYGYAEDALTVRYSSDVIIANCSFSWGTDETVSLYGNTRFTLQNSIIANSLNDSIHPKGEHGYGGIWGGRKASFINNLIANHKSRTPRINGHRLKAPYAQKYEYVELINNVIFNWGANSVYGNEAGRVSIVNNYYIPGPDSKVRHFIDQSYHANNPKTQLYLQGNILHNEAKPSLNNHQNVVVRNQSNQKLKGPMIPKLIFSDQPYLPLTEHTSAFQTFKYLIDNKNVGAFKTLRGHFHDSIDTSVLNQVKKGMITKADSTLLINHEKQNITNIETYAKEFQ